MKASLLFSHCFIYAIVAGNIFAFVLFVSPMWVNKASSLIYQHRLVVYLRTYILHSFYLFIYFCQTNVQENNKKQINGAILWVTLHLLLPQLFDLRVVWTSMGNPRRHPRRHCQLIRSSFPTILLHSLHNLLREREKSMNSCQFSSFFFILTQINKFTIFVL